MYPFDRSIQADWSAIYEELCAQTVDSLSVDILSSVDISLQMQYLQNTGTDLLVWYRIMEMQQELYALFHEAGIPFVILKGAAAAIYYPQPSYRRMGDIDVLVKPSDYDMANELLKKNQFVFSQEDERRHISYDKNGIHIELHHSYALFNDPKASQLLDGLLLNAIDQMQLGTIENYHFPMLPTYENGLVLLSHLDQHLESGLGLRQVIDWMLYVHHELDDNRWHTTFRTSAQTLGLETLAITVTRMCQLYLGLGDQITWCRDADTALCHRLMDLIIERGNFGRKAKHDDAESMRTMHFMNSLPLKKSPVVWLKTLQNRGCYHWKALKKYPWLKPFAWVYQICRYIRIGLSRKNPIRNFKKDYSKKRQYDDLLDQLGASRFGKELHSTSTKH